MSIKVDVIDCADIDCAYNINYKCTSELHNITPKNILGFNLVCAKKIKVGSGFTFPKNFTLPKRIVDRKIVNEG